MTLNQTEVPFHHQKVESGLYSTLSDMLFSSDLLHKHTGNVFLLLFCLSCSVTVKIQSLCRGAVNVLSHLGSY